ncbi:hypothetical protein [Candidatus Odyssella thessalonicensis]|uniref:hypothetical protein n=1 Tax=Candidatus Odyssella thessalonicensis TaxID=84647 RepID=UPI000225BC55|nr:hypothetical protein [Candidatus Odyssella thessalonicensis]
MLDNDPQLGLHMRIENPEDSSFYSLVQYAIINHQPEVAISLIERGAPAYTVGQIRDRRKIIYTFNLAFEFLNQTLESQDNKKIELALKLIHNMILNVEKFDLENGPHPENSYVYLNSLAQEIAKLEKRVRIYKEYYQTKDDEALGMIILITKLKAEEQRVLAYKAVQQFMQQKLQREREEKEKEQRTNSYSHSYARS